MASSYDNELRLNEMATGDASGTWGDITNVNLNLIGEAFSYGTEAITTNADTHATVIADGATDPGRSMYLKYTGTLDSACTITISPNTVSKLWFIENATSGSQNIILSCGSGANITILPGDTKVVYSDGAGAGAAFVDAFASLSVVDLIVGGDIDLEGSIDVNGTANLDVVDIDGAVNMATTALVTGVLTTTATQVATGGITSGSDIISDTDSTDSLGSTGVRWLKGWFDSLTAGTLTVGSGSVTDSSGAISFGDENLTTTGIVTAAGTSVFTNLDISGDVDVDGTLETDNLTVGGAQGTDGQVLTSTGSGVGWEAGGATDINGLSDAKTFGTSSIMLGDATTGTIDGANYNTGLGVDVFAALTSGDNNVAVGFAALDALTTGGNNVGIGYRALSASNDSWSVAIGSDALAAEATGGSNTAVGGLALAVSDGGSNNTAIGKQALTSLTTADHNTAVGSNAMFNITTGHGNVAVGYLAAYSLEGGSGDGKNNVAIGREAMELQTTQEDIIAIGYNAMGNGNSTSNSQNTCVGSQAMSDAGLAGYGNTVMGYLSGSGMTSAVHNTLIGRQADTVLTTGDENIVITSYNARTSAAAGTGQIVIGHNIVGKGNNTGLFGGASGVYNEGNTTAWSTVSDERIKKNITDNNIGLEAINKIQVRNFEYRTEDEITELPKESVIKKEGNQVGVIAQEIQEILPDLIKEQTTGCLSVNPDNLTWYLINAVQELSAEIKKLKGE
jgi:hypothetical protein